MSTTILNGKVVRGVAAPALLDGTPTKVLDTRGMVCPYPSFETAKALKTLPSGTVLEVLTDNDLSALESIPTVVQQRGCEYVVLEFGPSEWTLRIRKP